MTSKAHAKEIELAYAESAMKLHIAYSGPLACMVNAGSLWSYKGGIIEDDWNGVFDHGKDGRRAVERFGRGVLQDDGRARRRESGARERCQRQHHGCS